MERINSRGSAMFHHPSPLRPGQLAVLPGGKGGDLPVAPGGAGRHEAGLPSRRHVGIAFGVAILAALLWAWSGLRDTRAMRNLPAVERAALCQRTRENLREICQGRDRPREFCRAQATLLLDLPECDVDCQGEARRELMADFAVK
jgi:hypothetical protein